MSPTLTTCAASMPHAGHWCLGPLSHVVVLIWKGAEGCSRSQPLGLQFWQDGPGVQHCILEKSRHVSEGKAQEGTASGKRLLFKGRGCASDSEIPWSSPYSAGCQLLENPHPHPFGPGSFQASPASPWSCRRPYSQRGARAFSFLPSSAVQEMEWHSVRAVH